MASLLKAVAVAVAVALVALVAVAGATQHPCALWQQQLSCTDRGLTLAPPGVWPNVSALHLDNNPITTFSVNSFRGFPAVTALSAQFTLLSALELEDLLDMPLLESLNLQHCAVRSVKGLPEGAALARLDSVYLYGNAIAAVQPDFLLGAPALRTLSLSGNPLAVPAATPVLIHPELRNLFLGFGCDLGDVSPVLLSGLPNLQSVSLLSANVTSVAGAFAANRRLTTATLTNNLITHVAGGTFAAEGALKTVYLEGNPLQKLDAAAVDAAMAFGGWLWLQDTPLACDCAYEELHDWSKTRGVSLAAWCTGRPQCPFAASRRSPSVEGSSQSNTTSEGLHSKRKNTK